VAGIAQHLTGLAEASVGGLRSARQPARTRADPVWGEQNRGWPGSIRIPSVLRPPRP